MQNKTGITNDPVSQVQVEWMSTLICLLSIYLSLAVMNLLK